MHLMQMFPSDFLSALDLRAFASGGPTVVTIEAIEFMTLRAKRPGDAEIAYYVKFREFKKMMKLNRMNAETIAAVIGSPDTDAWLGQTVSIFPVQIQMPDSAGGRKLIWVTNVDYVKPTAVPALGPNTDITGWAFGVRPGLAARPPGAATGASEVVGMETAAQICSELSKRGRTWDDLVKHAKTVGADVIVAGKMPFDSAGGIVDVARAFVRMFPKIAEGKPPEFYIAAWRPPPEVIDRTTGEVKPVGGAAEADQQFDDSDIPF